MQRSLPWSVLSVLASISLGAGILFGQETPPAGPAAAATALQPGIRGFWQVKSITKRTTEGKHQTITSKSPPISATISAQQIVLRVGTNLLAEMSYALDARAEPWTIDLKASEGELLGICRRNGGALQISVNDKANGRASDFNADANGMVFDLHGFQPTSLFVINNDGTDLHHIATPPELTFVGSPAWSPDGRKIACDAWRSLYGEGFGEVQMLAFNADGGDVKRLGAGAMPSWSPNGKQIAFSANLPQYGVYVMDADGGNRRLLVEDGWGIEWSPKRNQVAYTKYDNGAQNLYVYDLDKGERRMLLQRTYRQITWGLTWSPDGDWLCFRGTLPDDRHEIAAVSAQGEQKGFKVILPATTLPEAGNANATLAWGGTGSQILVSMKKRSDRWPRLYIFEFAKDQPPQPFPGGPRDWGHSNMAWSTAAQKVAFTGVPAMNSSPAK